MVEISIKYQSKRSKQLKERMERLQLQEVELGNLSQEELFELNGLEQRFLMPNKRKK